MGFDLSRFHRRPAAAGDPGAGLRRRLYKGDRLLAGGPPAGVLYAPRPRRAPGAGQLRGVPMSFADEPGITRKVWLFSIILGHSRWLWGRFVASQTLQLVMRCHVAAFEAIGGVPCHASSSRDKIWARRAERRLLTYPLRQRCLSKIAANSVDVAVAVTALSGAPPDRDGSARRSLLVPSN